MSLITVAQFTGWRNIHKTGEESWEASFQLLASTLQIY